MSGSTNLSSISIATIQGWEILRQNRWIGREIFVVASIANPSDGTEAKSRRF